MCKAYLLLAFILFQLSGISQVSISGPVCVVPGTTYEYIINGTWDSAATMQVCLTGGIITDSSVIGGCTVNGAPLGAVTVIWNEGVTAGILAVTTSQGNTTFNVTITTPLRPGVIDSAVTSQVIDTSMIPLTITCAVDTGGSCSPAYEYQWQQSDNAVDWADMTGNTGSSLSFSSSLAQTTYFRRKVTETGSGMIGYSSIAVVFVNVEP